MKRLRNILILACVMILASCGTRQAIILTEEDEKVLYNNIYNKNGNEDNLVIEWWYSEEGMFYVFYVKEDNKIMRKMIRINDLTINKDTTNKLVEVKKRWGRKKHYELYVKEGTVIE